MRWHVFSSVNRYSWESCKLYSEIEKDTGIKFCLPNNFQSHSLPITKDGKYFTKQGSLYHAIKEINAYTVGAEVPPPITMEEIEKIKSLINPRELEDLCKK